MMINKINRQLGSKEYMEQIETMIQSYQDGDLNIITSDANEFLKNSSMRIRSIELRNFRNIEHGKVSFPNCKPEDIRNYKPSMLGLYGQNGSGKTSIIMAISLLKDLLCGQPLGSKYESCIMHNHEKCTLSFELVQSFLGDEHFSYLSYDNQIYYSFDIIKSANTKEDGSSETRLHVINEVLSYKLTDCLGNVIKTKQKLFDARPSESDDKGRPFGNKTRYSRIIGNNTDVANSLRAAKAVAYDRSTSFVFSKKTEETLSQQYVMTMKKYDEDLKYIMKKTAELMELEEEIPDLDSDFLNEASDEEKNEYFNEIFKNYTNEQFDQMEKSYEAIEELVVEMEAFWKEFIISYDRFLFFSTIDLLISFGKHYLFVIDTTSTGLVNLNELWPILLWSLDPKKGPQANRVYLNMDKSSRIRENDYSSMKASLSAVSKVLNALVPGLSLDIVDLGKQITNDGKTKECIFEIMSIREENPIPLRYESDGVRRLVSILSLLIAAYNNPFFTIAIDEIDSGIFEYLLGEILKILSISAKGQIVFTSHNLRPLEVLPPKFLCFTTTNPEKKFVRLQNRGNSNFRDGYFRKIVLGTSDESVYSPTDRFEIEMAFYEAGLARGEDNE